MSYFKYHEDIEEAIAEAKYYSEADKVLNNVEDEKKKKRLEPTFKRYYVMKKIYYEVLYKINLLNNLVNINSKFLSEFIIELKFEFKKNQLYLMNLTNELFDELSKEDFDIGIVSPLVSSDKTRMKKNICELLFNVCFTYMNEEPYMDVSDILRDLNAIAYWSETNETNMLKLNSPNEMKKYIKITEFNKRICPNCSETTPNECCYCLHCGNLIGVE